MPIPPPPAPTVSPLSARGEAAAPDAPTEPLWQTGATFLAIAGFAFLVRYLYMLQARACPLFDVLIMDGRQYFNWATNLITGERGGWLGDQTFYQAPLYPYFLAVTRLAVGDDLWSIRLVQIGLGAISCGVLFLAGRSFFSRGVGITAGLMLALYPPAIFFDTLIQKAGLGLLWTVLLLWFIARAAQRPGILNFAAVGMTLGLLMLTREETILLAPVILAWMGLHCWKISPRAGATWGRRGVWGAAYIAGLALVLMPVAVRNYAVGGELVLTTSQAGPNFYIGNNPNATGMYAPLRPGRSNTPYERKDAVELAEIAMGRSLTPKEVSRYWISQSLEFITGQPGVWLSLMGRKAALLVNAYEVPDAEDQYFFERYSPQLRTLSSVWHLGVLLPLAAGGMVLVGSSRRMLAGGAWVLYPVLLTLMVGVVMFFVFGRYRFPMVPVLMLFAAAGPFAIAELVRAGRAARVALPAAGALLLGAGAAAASNWPLFERDFQLAMSYSNAGAAVGEAGDVALALSLYDEALRLEPNLPDTIANKAMIIGRGGRGGAGDMEEAIRLLREAARLRPGDARIEFRLGTALAETGSFPLAATHLGRAVELGPTDVDARTNYAMVLLQLGQLAPAVEQLRQVVRLDPGNIIMESSLAWILATTPDAGVANAGEAVRIAEDLVQRTSSGGQQNPEMLDILGAAYARAGRYEEAAATARRAVQIARELGVPELPEEIQVRLEGYEARPPRPWIQ
jgi:Flp pilus assembly protein TadD